MKVILNSILSFLILAAACYAQEKDAPEAMEYPMKPSKDDEFGGNITLGGSRNLQNVRAGDIVEVTGQVDLNNPDPFGKPTYRISSIQRLRIYE